MLFKRHTGLGQDPELLRMRRRPLYLTLMIATVVLGSLVVAVVLLRERRGSLLVTANQTEAFIVINGAKTPNEVGKLIRGMRLDSYNISVFKEGFICTPPSVIVQIRAGKTVKTDFILQPAPVSITEERPAEVVHRETEARLTNQTRTDRSQSQKPEPALPSLAQNSTTNPSASNVSPSPENSQETSPLTAQEKPSESRGTLLVKTIPEKGTIYFDDVFKGAGSVTLTDLDWGEIVVHFGELAGYRTPAPQKVFLTPDKPESEIAALYLPLIYLSAQLNETGKLVAQKSSVKTGYQLAEETPKYDAVVGPEIKYLQETKSFFWEIGYAFSNRNPAGVDFVEISFALPEHWDGVKPLELRLYGYSSDKRFPFAAGSHTGIDVYINQKLVRQDFAPQRNLSQPGSLEYDIIPVNEFLQVGQNQIRIQASKSSRCFYYLNKIVLL